MGGFRRFGGDVPITQENIELMLTSLQHRGVDASGCALLDPTKGIVVYRDDKPAWEMITSADWEKWITANLSPATTIALVHTRAATQGSPRIINNNHPLFHNKCAVVHNGIIHNDDSLFAELKMERFAETDSDVLRAICDREGLTKKAIKLIARCTGSVACAAISPEEPEKLLLVRSGSPLVLAACGEMLVWASEKNCIHKAMRPWVNKFGVDFQVQSTQMALLSMQDNSAWLFGAKGLELHEEAKICYSYTEPRRHVYDGYAERQSRWDGETSTKPPIADPVNYGATGKPPVRFRCRNTACRKLNRVAKKGLDIRVAVCGTCKTPLVQQASVN